MESSLFFSRLNYHISLEGFVIITMPFLFAFIFSNPKIFPVGIFEKAF